VTAAAAHDHSSTPAAIPSPRFSFNLANRVIFSLAWRHGCPSSLEIWSPVPSALPVTASRAQHQLAMVFPYTVGFIEGFRV
jgi:hypothetical protein